MLVIATSFLNQSLAPALTVKVQVKEVKRSLTTPLPAPTPPFQALAPTVIPV
jgi:hypothetical protein